MEGKTFPVLFKEIMSTRKRKVYIENQYWTVGSKSVMVGILALWCFNHQDEWTIRNGECGLQDDVILRMMEYPLSGSPHLSKNELVLAVQVNKNKTLSPDAEGKIAKVAQSISVRWAINKTMKISAFCIAYPSSSHKAKDWTQYEINPWNGFSI